MVQDKQQPSGKLPQESRAITLMTDFGLQDEYVAVMKGVILSNLSPCSQIQLIDITHQIPAQDIESAAFLLGRAYRYFPAGTVHLVVVDPGVGTARRIIAIESEQQLFVGPDNGVFTAVLQNAEQQSDSVHVYEVINQDLFLPRISRTFHGRDIMAPVAAKLASGSPISLTGDEIALETCNKLSMWEKDIQADIARGRVVHIDRFGNLCTNLEANDLAPFMGRGHLTISIGNSTISGLSESYGALPPGTLLAHFDSHFQMEIAVNGGSAADLLKIERGAEIIVRHRPK